MWFNWVVVANLFTDYKTVICFLKKTREKKNVLLAACLSTDKVARVFFIQIPKPGRPVFIVTGDWETSGVELLVHTFYSKKKKK